MGPYDPRPLGGGNSNQTKSNSNLDPTQHRRVENVQPGVDFIRNEFRRLLDESFDASIFFENDYAVFRRLVDPRYYDRPFVAVMPMEFDHLSEWKITDDVGIQDEKRFVSVEKIAGEGERTG